MTQEGDEAEAQEDEMVGEEPEVEKKREPEPEWKTKGEEGEEQKTSRKEKMNNAAYKDLELLLSITPKMQ